MTRLAGRDLLILAAIAMAAFVDGLDGSIVNVALPSVATDFGTDTGTIAWVTILYFMMVAGLLLPFGRVADSNRLKRIFIVGFAMFTAGSLACGISASLPMLFASRTVQGIGAAAIGAAGPVMCVKLLPMDRLPTSLTVLTLSCAIAYACGPAIGGFLTECLSWHWTFLVNVPIGVFAIAFGLLVMPRDDEKKRMDLDVPGTASLFAAVICGSLALETSSSPGAGAVCAASAAACVVLLAAFVLIELKASNPMLNVRMFKVVKLDSVTVSVLLMNIVYMGLFYLMPFYLSVVLGLGSAESGLVLLVPSVVVVAICLPIGRACERFGARPFAVMAAVTTLCYAAAFIFVEPGMGAAPFIAIGAFMGLAWGLYGAAGGARIVAHAPEGEKAMGSALSSFVFYIGATIGTALFASLMAVGSGSGGIPVGELPPEMFATGFEFSAMVAVALAAASVLAGWAVRKDP